MPDATYSFQNQIVGKAQIGDGITMSKLTMAGIDATVPDAEVIMGGLSAMFELVNWEVKDAVRIVNQNIIVDEK